MKIFHTIGAEAVLIAIIVILAPFSSGAATNADYCQAPPLKSEVSPNIMLVIDESLSMGYDSYSYGDSDGSDADTLLDGYDPSIQYEGYFDPTKAYKNIAASGSALYEETVLTGQPCVKTTCKTYKCYNNNQGGCVKNGSPCTGNKWACCDVWNTTGDCGGASGNYLNYKEMARIDIIRWAMTGGRPSTCTGSATFDGGSCEPEAWKDPGNSGKVGTACNDSLDVNGDGVAEGGCILLAHNGIKVKVPWERITGTNLVTGATGTSYGLAFAFANMPVKPRMGAMFYDGKGVRADKVYLGDFTGPTSTATYKYYNLITMVNSHNPASTNPAYYTATGPALWDTFNYYAMKKPEFGGFAQSSGGDDWKNPMYTCEGGGSTCQFLPCTDQFVILLSDGQWNYGGNTGNPLNLSNTCSIDTGSVTSADPVVPAYLMHKDFLNSASTVTTRVRSLYAIGLYLEGPGELAMKNIAMYGSFDRSGTTWPGNKTGYPAATCTTPNDSACPSDSAKGSPCTALPPSSADWDGDGDGVPDTFLSGKNATDIKASVMAAVLDILTHTSAGTAASVLASREGSGANLIQAVYYPKKTFLNGTVDWAGNLQNLWYYIDPAFLNSNIREDGRDSSGAHDLVLNLNTSLSTQKDYITQFYFDPGLQAAMANRWEDENGDASITGENKLTAIKVDGIANIWEAGQLLWNRDWLNRRIFTSDVAKAYPATNLMPFSCTNYANCPDAPTLKPYLNATDAADVLSDDEASTLMQWIIGVDRPWQGTHYPTYRKRRAQIGPDTKVWKLGDIINSTPKISTWQPLGDYHINYAKYETTYAPSSNIYQSDPVNTKYYITSRQYKGRGMVYAGGNDGMLHAFRLGLLQSKWPGQGTFEKAKLSNNVCSASKNIFCVPGLNQCPSGEACTGTVTLGEEVWAFIPKNALPYLKYLADPNYCHIYTVDLTPMVFDASIGYTSVCTQANYYDCLKLVDSWRTVLIGGMRLGGACRSPAAGCTDCVKTPIKDPANAGKGLGYSSYFALDITNQDTPKLMWEYDGLINVGGVYYNKLGMSYSGPAVMRISNSATWGVTVAGQRNGRWFVVFGSGPTGPIDTVQKSFMARSDQNLMLSIFDLATGPGVDNANVKIIDTGTDISNGFAGSITTTTFDVDLDYSDDVLYVPYVYGSTGLNGGILRLLTRGSIDPDQWTWGRLIDNTGPLTAAPDMLIDPETDDLWIYFGAGRYFYDTVTDSDDKNPGTLRQIFGLKETCLDAAKTGFQKPCPAKIDFCSPPSATTPPGANCGGLTNVTSIAAANALESATAAVKAANKGWYINLDEALPVDAPTLWGERVITNPSVDAMGIVYFTTYMPQNDACYKGGQTHIWAVKFDTGGSAEGLIQGTAIIQVSTGSIEQVNLSTAFTEKDNRRTAGIIGQPPTREGLTVIPGSKGESKLLFIKER